jgi:hypothetical protein
VRVFALFGNECRHHRSRRLSLKPSRLVVEPLERGQFLVSPESGLLDRRL